MYTMMCIMREINRKWEGGRKRSSSCCPPTTTSCSFNSNVLPVKRETERERAYEKRERESERERGRKRYSPFRGR